MAASKVEVGKRECVKALAHNSDILTSVPDINRASVKCIHVVAC